jgi:Flp pilus assembly pilin Flp
VDTSRSRSVLNRRGQALSEYALLVAVVGMGLVVILGLFGRATKQVWQNSESKFADEPGLASGGGSPAPYTGGGGGSSGGGAVSGAVQHTPPSTPPKNDPSDSTGSASADSLGSSPGVPPVVPQDIAQGAH